MWGAKEGEAGFGSFYKYWSDERRLLRPSKCSDGDVFRVGRKNKNLQVLGEGGVDGVLCVLGCACDDQGSICVCVWGGFRLGGGRGDENSFALVSLSFLPQMALSNTKESRMEAESKRRGCGMTVRVVVEEGMGEVEEEWGGAGEGEASVPRAVA